MWQMVCFIQVMWPLPRTVRLELQNFYFVTKLYVFRHLLCPSSGVISCTRGNWYASCRLRGRCLGESGWNLVADVKYARVSTSTPTVNMWCAHTTNPSNSIAIKAKIIPRFPNASFFPIS
jgi:hypothetical protein